MKILVIDQFFYPEVFQVNTIVKRLVEDGHEVTVLTGLPNYPTGIVPEEYKHGKRRVDNYYGAKVIRCFEIGRKPGFFGMSKNYLSFCFSSYLKSNTLKEKFDVIFVYQTSPVTMIVPGANVAKKTGTPLVVYCCDIWPEVLKVMIKSENSITFKILKKISTNLYSKANLIAVQSKSFFDYFKKAHNIDEKEMRYLPHFSDSSYLSMDFSPVNNDVVDFVFTGNVGIAQNIDGIINATSIIRDIPNFKVHIVGDGSYYKEALRLVKEKGLEDKILFYGRKPYEDMPNFYRLADVCLATLQANSEIAKTIPSKVQGYMAAGKPIIAALDGYSKQVIEDANCGIVVKPGDYKELANAMARFIKDKDMYKNCGINGRKYYEMNFTFDKFMDNLYSIFNEVLKRDY